MAPKMLGWHVWVIAEAKKKVTAPKTKLQLFPTVRI